MRILLPALVVAVLGMSLVEAAPRRTARRRAAVAPVDVVADRDVARLLAERYGRRVGMPGGARVGAAEPRLCADSQAVRGDRHVAVCTPTETAAARRLDLYVIAPPANRGEAARIRAAFNGLALGRGDDVAVAELGPARRAFVVRGIEQAGPVERSTQAYYEEYQGRLRDVLHVVTGVRSSAACSEASTPAGRRCRARSVDLRCEPRMDAAVGADGYYPLALHVTGQRAGKRVEHVLPIPHDAYGYVVSARVLSTQGCGTAG